MNIANVPDGIQDGLCTMEIKSRMHAWLSNIHTCHIIITAAFGVPHYYNCRFGCATLL